MVLSPGKLKIIKIYSLSPSVLSHKFITHFKYPISFIFFLCFADFSQAQESPEFLERFDRYHYETLFEKAYLHTGNEVMTLGDTLRFSSFVVEGRGHLPVAFSKILYVDLIDPNEILLLTRTLRVDSTGRSTGDFAIADSLIAGTYQLRAYTKYMSNFDQAYFFKKSIKVLPRLNTQEEKSISVADFANVSVQFFPESGELLTGQLNYVAFKATDEKGLPVTVEGEILNQSGEVVTSLEYLHDGMGIIQLQAEINQRYFCRYFVEGIEFSQPLPEVKSDGYIVNVRSTPDKVYVTVKGTDVSFEGTNLLIQNKGRIVKVFQPSPGASYLYKGISRDELPSGVSQITFFNKKQEAVAERLIYNERSVDFTDLEVITSPSVISTRQSLDLTYNMVRDTIEEGLISTTILPSQLYDGHQQTIKSYLLFTSDIKGYIHNPSYYTDETNENRLIHADLLLLTHGWRRFDWDQLGLDEQPVLGYLPEQGFSVSGQVVKYDNREKGVATNLYLSFVEDPLFRVDGDTDENGYFTFLGLDVFDTLTAYVKTLSGRSKKSAKDKLNLGTFVNFLPRESPKLESSPLQFAFDEIRKEEVIKRGQKLFDIESAFGNDVLILDEMEVKGRVDRSADPFSKDVKLYGKPDQRLVLDSINTYASYNSVIDLIRGRVPGVEVIGDPPNQSIRIRGYASIEGDNTPLFLLDGNTVDINTIKNVIPREVLYIDVLKGASKTVVYGSRGATGVIAIYTRAGSKAGVQKDYDQQGFGALEMPGYYPPREFYIPNHSSPSNSEKIRPDYRSILYWNPDIRTVDGTVKKSFFTSDEKGEFIILTEGVTTDGRIIMSTTSFMVN